MTLAQAIRGHALRMVVAGRASHIGSCLSCADILAVLYGGTMRFDAKRPGWPERDRLIFSKGHAAAALYAVLAECGFFPVEELKTYGQDGSRLTGHVSHHVPGIEVSTGSLGHGLAIGCGLAMAATGRTFVLLSDGELDEGSTWESALFAGHHRLSKLTAIVDHNQIQSYGRVADVLDLEPLADKWRAFRWNVHVVDGHDHAALRDALKSEGPNVILARTIKGKGVSFMEDDLAWHYRTPSAEQLAAALAEVAR